MPSGAVEQTALPVPQGAALVGRMFVNPLVDYLFVGAGLSLPIFAALYFVPSMNTIEDEVPYGLFLAVNGAHFAASTVRLYTKPGARQQYPFLSWILPMLCLAVVGVGLNWPRVGGHLTALYFTWSPFHYAAQTYGLAVMYAMRSGAKLGTRDKAQIWWVCMLPFIYSFFTTPTGGLFWFVPRGVLSNAVASGVYQAIVAVLVVAVLLLPVSLFWQLRRMRGRHVPLISLLLQVTNGIWWLGSDYLNAWFWTAIFHSIQYLVIVTVHHVNEQVTDRPSGGRLRPAILHGTAFYGFSLVVGVLLFLGAPGIYAAMGFNGLESYALMTVVINLHHFIVDGFIWRRPPQPAADGAGLEGSPALA